MGNKTCIIIKFLSSVGARGGRRPQDCREAFKMGGGCQKFSKKFSKTSINYRNFEKKLEICLKFLEIFGNL